MKKTLSLLLAAAMAAVFFAGCTVIESTQKFNRVSLGSGNEKAVCQTFVEIPGYYFFGIPIVVGSVKGNGTWTMFRDNVTTENAVYLLTKEIKDRRAARAINVHVNATDNFFFIGCYRRSIQASGTGVRTRGSALDTAAQEFDRQP